MKLLHLFLFLILTGIVQAQNSPTLAQANAFIDQQKAAFEENKGQVWDTEGNIATKVKYHFKDKGIDIFMLPQGLAYQFTKVYYPEDYKVNYKGFLSPDEEIEQNALRAQIRTETYRMDMELVNANPNATIIADGESKDYVQYYNRNALDVHSFKKLTYQDVYSGIDWVIYTTEKGLKYDFIVHPEADPSQIQLKFKHHEDLKINADGSFTLSNSMGSITEQAPISFQGEQDIATTFKLAGDIISFDLSNYDKTKSLTIDPNLIWATYYGGLGTDNINDCLVDDSGNIYLTGTTNSTANIALAGYQDTLGGGSDVFVVKLDSNGVRQFATYYGGPGYEGRPSVGIDAMGNYYLGGETSSSTNIAFNGHQTTPSGARDAFVVKFNPTGVRQWASYYGGNNNELVGGCAVDSAGNVYIAGRTTSIYGISFNGHQNNYTSMGYCSAFLAKFNTTGALQWGTYYGTEDWAEASNCTVDAAGNVYIVGKWSWVAFDFISLLVKFNPAGVLQWSNIYTIQNSYLSEGTDCAIDKHGNVYTVGNHNPNNAPNQNAFLIKFDSIGAFQWTNVYGGSGFDSGTACGVDTTGNVYLVGSTSSSTGIAFNGHQNTIGGNFDAFIAKFNPAGVRQWASYYGGHAREEGLTCAFYGAGNIYLAGVTSSTSGIASNGHQNTLIGGDEGFVVRFNESLGCCTSTGTDTITTCNSYTWIDGITYTASNYSASYILTNVAGYDSIVYLNLTINTPNTGTDTQLACGPYTWIDGITYTANNNSATHTLTNMAGCDSIVTLDLTFGTPSTSTDIRTACNSYTWMDGNTYTSSTNTPTRTLTNSTGCDSVITLNLTILNSNTGTDIQTACDAYTWIDGNTYTSSTNSPTFALTNAAGCDSIITLDLTIINSSTGTDVQTACVHYTWIDGNTYTSSNNSATFSLTNAAGCDSIITLDLTIKTVDTAIAIIGSSILANASRGIYQWLDCDNGYAPILGETLRIFNPTSAGNYALMFTENACTDTSACILFGTIGITNLNTNNNINIYPNPSTGKVIVDFGTIKVQDASIKVYSVDGKLIQYQTQVQGTSYSLDLPESNGLYILEIQTKEGLNYYKVIKE